MMKKVFLACLSLALVFGPLAARCDWLFDPAAERMTDGNWTVRAKALEGGGLSVFGFISAETGGELDLRLPVADGDGKTYPVVSVGGFNWCKVLTGLRLPDTLTTIAGEAFHGASSLREVTPFLPPSVVSIGRSAFYDCTALEGKVSIVNPSVGTLPYCAFYNCPKLQDADLSGVSVVGEWAFSKCPALTNVVLSATLSRIEPDGFSGCSSLVTVTPFFPDTLSFIGNNALANCGRIAGDLRLANEALESIGNGGFQGCKGLTSASLPGIRSIGVNAFRSCESLTNLVLSSSLTSIGESAFQHCKNLATIAPFFPDTLVSLGKNAFWECYELRGDLRLANPSLPEAPYCSFYRCYSLESADLSGAAALGEWAFDDCRSLTNVVLSSSLRTIGQDCFAGCGSLVSVLPLLPDTLTSIGANAFANCKQLKGDLRIVNEQADVIPDTAFNGCAQLTSATIPGAETIGERAFDGCQALTNVVFSKTLASIGVNAFNQNRALVSVRPFLPPTLTSIGVDAFYECVKLGGDLEIVNPSIATIPYGVFYKCLGLTSATLTGPTNIGEWSFSRIPALTNVVLSKKLRSIEGNAFSGCGALATVSPFLPETVTTVKGSAFGGCASISSPLYLSNPAMTNFGPGAFSGMTSLKEVHFSPGRVRLDNCANLFQGVEGADFYFPKFAPVGPIPPTVFGNQPWTRQRLHGSLRIDPAGWAKLVSPLTETEPDDASYPGPKTFGVLANPGGGGIRHWCIDWRSPLESHALFLRLR